MKKSYVKPYVCYENFQLSASIAGSCADGVITKNPQRDTCGIPLYGEKVLFTAEAGFCTTTPQEAGTPCYDVPYDYSRYFGS